MNGYTYIASPYTHEDATVRQMRYERVRDFTAKMATLGMYGFCPIAHSHDMGIANKLPYHVDFWREWNYRMIDGASSLLVYMLDGWKQSKGVQEEIEYARKLGKPIFFYDPKTEIQHADKV